MIIIEQETFSITEDHQPRVEHDLHIITFSYPIQEETRRQRNTYRHEDMAADHQRERDDQRPVPPGDLPLEGHKLGREDDHHRDAREADDERQLEALPDAGHCKEHGAARSGGKGYI
jgi:hypothetical protein